MVKTVVKTFKNGSRACKAPKPIKNAKRAKKWDDLSKMADIAKNLAWGGAVGKWIALKTVGAPMCSGSLPPAPNPIFFVPYPWSGILLLDHLLLAPFLLQPASCVPLLLPPPFWVLCFDQGGGGS